MNYTIQITSQKMMNDETRKGSTQMLPFLFTQYYGESLPLEFMSILYLKLRITMLQSIYSQTSESNYPPTADVHPSICGLFLLHPSGHPS